MSARDDRAALDAEGATNGSSNFAQGTKRFEKFSPVDEGRIEMPEVGGHDG
jgi:hypothetical protein